MHQICCCVIFISFCSICVSGFKLLLQVFQVTPGTVEEITQLLQDGKLVAVAPGGVREALFSTSNYDLIWGKRCGFAKSALAAKVVRDQGAYRWQGWNLPSFLQLRNATNNWLHSSCNDPKACTEQADAWVGFCGLSWTVVWITSWGSEQELDRDWVPPT